MESISLVGTKVNSHPYENEKGDVVTTWRTFLLKLENNSIEMTKKDEGKKPSTQQKLKRTKGSEGVRKISTIWDHFT